MYGWVLWSFLDSIEFPSIHGRKIFVGWNATCTLMYAVTRPKLGLVPLSIKPALLHNDQNHLEIKLII